MHLCARSQLSKQSFLEILTVLLIEQHFKAIGFIVIKDLPDFVYRLPVCQLAVHETAGWTRREKGKWYLNKKDGRMRKVGVRGNENSETNRERAEKRVR